MSGGRDGAPEDGAPDGGGPGAGPGPVLQVRGLDVVRGGRRTVQGVDLDVAAGQVVALVGPNGAGKSTLLGAVARDLAPAAGRVLLHGHDLALVRPRDLARRRAVLPQEQHVAFAFTVLDVVHLGRAPWRGTPAARDDDAVVGRCLELCDVAHLADRTVTTLSGGERARVALARVLAQQAPLLLLDEPTAALDLGHQELVLRTAVAHARAAAPEGGAAGRATVVVLHDLTLAAAYADTVVVLDAGRVVAHGAPREVLRPDLLSRVWRCPVEVVDHPVTGAPLVLPVRVGAIAGR